MPKNKKAAKKKVKKPLKKKASPKKTTKKKAAKKKISKKRVVVRKKAARKKTAAKRKPATAAARKQTPVKKATVIKPGPPPSGIPPVEEPLANEEALGVITHYFSHIGVAVIQLNKGSLKTGDKIHVKGHTTDFIQSVESMEYEHQHIDKAGAGQSFGLKIKDHAREHDIVYRVK